jgi:type IV fimbrial biogenesis protein FimT
LALRAPADEPFDAREGKRSMNNHSPRRTARGITLVELLVTVAMLVIVLSIGLPSFEGASNTSKLASTASELSAAVQLARSEAVRRNRNAVLCRSENGTSCAAGTTWSGWIVFVDDDGDDQADSSETLVRTGTVPAGIGVRGSPAITSRDDRITFLATGVARGANARTLLTATLGICVASTRPSDNERDLSIAFGSRTTVRSKSTGGSCGQPNNS